MNSENNTYTIGAGTKAIRKEKGWTQAQMASKLQLSRNSINNYEQEITEPHLNVIKKLSEISGKSCDNLIRGKDIDILEHLKQHTKHIEQRMENTEQRIENMEQRIENMEQHIENMEQRIENMEQRIENMEQHIENMEQHTEQVLEILKLIMPIPQKN